MNDVVSSPFANTHVAARPTTTAVAQTDASRAVAEVQAAMLIARSNPRDPVAAMDRILNACTRPTLADAAVYQYSKGGSDVSGPSIRLAEAMAQQWGNIKTSVRELDQSGGVSTVQTIAWDLETGYQCDKVFHVPHIRHTRQGSKRLEDPRDIYELVANQGARRLRACILAVIPGDVTEAAVSQCELTMRTKADTSPEAMAKMVAAFAAFGVTKAQLETRIQRHLDAIQPAQVVSLKKIYASMRDGMSTAAEWFDPVEPAPGSAEANPAGQAKTGADAAKEALRKRTAPSTPSPVIDPADNPEAGADPKPARTFAEVAAAINKAKTPEAFDFARSLIADVADEQQRAELHAAASKRYAEIGAGE